MPINDKDERKIYQRLWARQRAEKESPEEKALRLSKRREWRRKRIAAGGWKDGAWSRKPENREKKRIASLRESYGKYWQAKEAQMTLERLFTSRPDIFNVIPQIKADNQRRKRR